jgi:DNA polymerase-3 subunit chi
MTQVDFYTHVDNKTKLACILSAKALERGRRVMIFTPDTATTKLLDHMLWTTPAIGFLPHCHSRDALAEVTPIIIDHAPETFNHDDILLNLTVERPAFFSRFQRLIEIVTLDENDRQAARERFRFYRDRGYEIQSHDLSQARQT